MNKIIQIIIGLIILLLPIYLWISGSFGLGESALIVLKGSIMWGLMLIGLLTIIIGISELRS